MGLLRQRAVHQHEVRLGEQFVEAHCPHAQGGHLFRAHEGVVGQVGQREPLQLARHEPRNASEAHQAQRLALHAQARCEPAALPRAAAHGAILRRDLAHHGQQ